METFKTDSAPAVFNYHLSVRAFHFLKNKPTDGYHAGPNNLKLALNICELK